MKIKYRHHQDPEEIRFHDTETSLQACSGFMRAMGGIPTQQEWDAHTLKRMAEGTGGRG